MTPNIDLVTKLVNAATDIDQFTIPERKMFLRYFLYETFNTWMSQTTIAEMTGITSPTTVCLQIKKLNKEEKYHFTIVKIRQMIRELQLNTPGT